MATIPLSIENLQSLVSALSTTSSTINPTSQLSIIAAQDINLSYSSAEILAPNPPTLDSPQRVVSITIDGVRYTNNVDWTRAWQSAFNRNRQFGLTLVSSIVPDAEHVVSVLGVGLTNPMTTVTTTTVGATTSTVTSTQRSLRGVSNVYVDSNGYLRVEYTDGVVSVAGYVEAPTPSFVVGSVTPVDYGAGSSVTVTGEAPNFILNFVIERPEADLLAIRSTDSWTDPAWLTLTPGYLGLGDVTNESKAQMFTNPTFTGTTNTGDLVVGGTLGVTGAMTLVGNIGLTGNITQVGDLGVTGNITQTGTLGVTGAMTLNGLPIITQPTIIALGLAF